MKKREDCPAGRRPAPHTSSVTKEEGRVAPPAEALAQLALPAPRRTWGQQNSRRPHPPQGRALSPHPAASKARPGWSQAQALLTVGRGQRQGRVHRTLRNSPDPSTRAHLGHCGERPGHVHTKHPDPREKPVRPSALRWAPGRSLRLRGMGRRVPHALPPRRSSRMSIRG